MAHLTGLSALGRFLGTSTAKSLAHTTNTTCRTLASYYRATQPAALPMKAGTTIPGLDVVKDKDAPVALERDEYPDFVNGLATPMPTLAQLRRIPEEEADDKLKMRYLKLKRRMVIKENNQGLAK